MRRGKEKANESKIMSESLAAEGNGGLSPAGDLWKLDHISPSFHQRMGRWGIFITDWRLHWLRLVPSGVCSPAILGHGCSTPRHPAVEMERAPMQRSREIPAFEV